jgi:triacylglycerol lipase
MSVARLQQLLIFTTITSFIAWSIFAPSYIRPSFAIGGAVAIAFGYSLVLASEFALLLVFGVEAGGRRPTLFQVVRAWLGETFWALRVFGWRQPFRCNAEPDWVPDLSRPGVLLVHGFFCNRGFWNPWMARLRAAEIPHVAVNLEPMFGSIDFHSPTVELAISRLWKATGHAPFVIAHSMGGLVIRSWLAGRSTDTSVRKIFTIGSPHRGTWLARFSAALNGSQMRLGSSWLHALAEREPSSRGLLFVCYYSNCDNIVFPPSAATLPGADNRRVDGIAHVHMAFHPRVMAPILAEISAMTAKPIA